jgi:hypothetical protein
MVAPSLLEKRSELTLLGRRPPSYARRQVIANPNEGCRMRINPSLVPQGVHARRPRRPDRRHLSRDAHRRCSAGGGQGRPADARGCDNLMETYCRLGELSTIFARRLVGQRWLYGSFSAGQSPPQFRTDGSCYSCHQSARAIGTMFTCPMIDGFAATGLAQRTTCDRPGRSSCPTPT